MSVSASIDIKVKGEKALEFIEALEDSEWNFNDNGQITYLPVRDEDFNWKRVELNNFEQVKSELIKKIAYKEILGLVILWKDTEVGGILNYFTSSNEVSFILTINRKVVADTNYTDFSWYIEKISPILGKLEIERIECVDIM